MSAREAGRAARLVAALLLAVYVGVALTSVREKSATADEPAHIAGGLSYWTTGEFRLNPENGILPQLWAALPLYVAGDRFPSRDQQAWRDSDVFAIGYQLLYEVGNDAESILRRSRVMITLLGAVLGAVVFLWSRELFGVGGGLVSLTLYVLHPSVIAHGQLATSDMAAALFFTLSAWCLWRMINRSSVLNVAAGVMSLSGLFLSKMSAVLIVPMALLMLGMRIVRGEPLPLWRWRVRGRIVQLLLLLVIGFAQVAAVVFLIWAAYGFRYEAFVSPVPGRDRFLRGWDEPLKDSGVVGKVVQQARGGRWLPESYLYGFALVVSHAKERPQFLNGRSSGHGWPWFFPYCFLVKTPLPVFLVLVSAFAAGVVRPSVVRWRDEMGGERSTAPLWILLAVYWTAAIASSLNIGERHTLPALPALLILAGASSFWFTADAQRAGARSMGGIVVVGLLLSAAETGFTYPHYLAYFNQLVGGPRHGYRHLVDSSLDWGQDVPGLKRWLDERGLPSKGQPPVYLAYFGMGNPAYYGISARPLPSFPEFRKSRDVSPLTPGLYCVSATMVQSVLAVAQGAWTETYERAYQGVQAEVGRFWTTDEAGRARLLAERGRDYWDRTFGRYDDLRFGRLCAHLRAREPDAQVGYSINIYLLTADDIERVLHGAPAELRPD